MKTQEASLRTPSRSCSLSKTWSGKKAFTSLTTNSTAIGPLSTCLSLQGATPTSRIPWNYNMHNHKVKKFTKTFWTLRLQRKTIAASHWTAVCLSRCKLTWISLDSRTGHLSTTATTLSTKDTATWWVATTSTHHSTDRPLETALASSRIKTQGAPLTMTRWCKWTLWIHSEEPSILLLRASTWVSRQDHNTRSYLKRRQSYKICCLRPKG